MQRRRHVAAGRGDVRHGESGVGGSHRARLEVEYPPRRHFPLRGQGCRIVVRDGAADHRQRRPADRRGTPPASAVTVELNPILLRRDQRSSAPHSQGDGLPELLRRAESDEPGVVLQLRVRQALVLHQQAIRPRPVSQPDPVGEERRAGFRLLAEVVLRLRRDHHVRAQFDPTVRVPAEHQVEGRAAPSLVRLTSVAAAATSRSARAPRKWMASNRLLFPTPLWPMKQVNGPKRTCASRMLLKFLTDRLTSMGRVTRPGRNRAARRGRPAAAG